MSVEINETNFPDSVFRQFISTYLDTNSSGVLEDDEIEAIESINMPSLMYGTIPGDIATFQGIELFTNLKELVLGVNQSNIVLDSLSALEKVSIKSYGSSTEPQRQLRTFAITNCSHLKQISFPWCYLLESANTNGCINLELLDLYACYALEVLTINECYKLKGINLATCNLQNLDLSGRDKLELLQLDFPQSLESLDLSGCTNLKYLWVSRDSSSSAISHLTDINIKDCESLRILELSGQSAIQRLILPNADDLHSIQLDGLELPAVNISKNAQLKEIVSTATKETTSTSFGRCYLYRSGGSIDSNLENDSLYRAITHTNPSYPDTLNYISFPVEMILSLKPVEIVEQPEDIYLSESDQGAAFTVEAVGDRLQYQWQKWRETDEIWEDIAVDADTNSYYVENDISNNNSRYRCLVYNTEVIEYSDPASFYRVTSPIILQQPSDISVTEGSIAVFQITAKKQGNIEYEYQWQFSADDGTSWTDIDNSNADKYEFIATLSINNYQYRCVVSNDLGEAISNPAILTVTEATPPGIPIDAEHFPDQYFRALVARSDFNQDGFLDDDEIARFTTISLCGPDWNPSYDHDPISSLQGIEYLTNLRTVELLGYLSLTGSVDVRNLQNLEDLRLIATNVTNVDVRGCEKLKVLKTQSSPINSLLLSNNTSLETLNVSYMPTQNPGHSYANLQNLDLHQCPALRYLTADKAGITSLDTSGCPDLEVAYLAYNPDLIALDISKNKQLRKLETYDTNISELNITKNPVLKNLYDNYPGTDLYGGIKAYNLSDSDNYPDESIAYRLAYSYNTTTIISELIRIITHPQSITVDEDDSASFYIAIETEVQDITYQWEYKRPGDTHWIVIEGSDSETYTVLASNEKNNYQYRCLVSCEEAMVYSKIASLTIYLKPRIVTNPSDETAVEGSIITLHADGTGSDISYKWQYSSDEQTTWIDIENATEKDYTVVADITIDGFYYRCQIENRLLILQTESALVTIIADSRTIQPASLSLLEGSTGEIEVIPKNDPNVPNTSYQWQYLMNDGETWADLKEAKLDKYIVYATLGIDGMQYRCKVNNSFRDIYTDPITVTVIPDTSISAPDITTQPSSVTVAEGSSVTFAVEVSGSDISYQWQVFKNNQWTNIQNAASASYTTVGTRSADGNRYRCVISNAAGAVQSDPATLMVTMGIYVSTPRVLIQPRSVNVDLGELATFWIRADGGDLSYQWQKLNNGTWYDITGAISTSYVVMAKTEVHNTQYRCVVTNTAGSVISNTAMLSIRAGHDLSFYGYHSIIISGKNTYGEWEMYPTSRPHVAPPEVKTNYVDLPGADGGIDYTDLLTGEPRYGYRKGSWEFLLIPQDRWAAVYRSLVSFLHGKQHTVILEDDPNYVYTGRLSVNEWRSEPHNSLITIDYTLEPFPRDISGQEEDEEENQTLSMATTLLNKEKYAGMVISKLNGAATLVYPDMLFENGDNIAY